MGYIFKKKWKDKETGKEYKGAGCRHDSRTTSHAYN
jgi:hypothetical protein